MNEKLDEVGIWTETKLKITRAYIREYSKILARQPNLKFAYIDAFAGAGTHLTKETGNEIPGSPRVALDSDPSFHEYHFIEMNPERVERLRHLAAEYPKLSVQVHQGDCNHVLPNKILPTFGWRSFRRAFCLIDPYGMNLRWDVVKMAGELGTVEILLNFPVLAMNRNALLRNPEVTKQSQVLRMTDFWGDDSWRDELYRESLQGNLFGEIDEEKVSNAELAKAYCKRLKEVAGFKYVSDPRPMLNTNNAVLYYLIFASPKKTGDKIMSHILKRL